MPGTGTRATAFLSACVGGQFTTRIGTAGAKAGRVAGLVIALTWLAFAQTSDAERLRLSEALFGRISLVSFPWNALDPLVVALSVSLVVTMAESLRTRPSDPGHLDRCLAGIDRSRR